MATLEVGAGKQYPILRAAVAAAKRGDRIEVQAGVYAGKDAPCYITIPDLTVVAVGGRVILNARDSANKAYNVQDKGLLVVETPAGSKFTLQGFDICGAAVSSGAGTNGAGIRLIDSDLECVDCGFFWNQDGILSGSGPVTVRLIGCHLANNGTGRGTEHNIYISTGAKELYMECCISRNSPSGACVKSRAAKTTVLYSLLGESAGGVGDSNYEFDASNAGEVTLIGNLILQSPATINAHIITSGGEGLVWPINKLTLLHNTIVGLRNPSIFVRTKPENPVELVMKNNLLVGPGTLVEGPAAKEDVGNVWVKTLAAAAFAGANDYRLMPEAPGAAPASIAAEIDPALVPFQPAIPFGTEPRATWTEAGAYSRVTAAPAMSVPSPPVPKLGNPTDYVKLSTAPTPPVVVDPPVPPAPAIVENTPPGALRAQWVNQRATLQTNGAWSYGKPYALNVQVWRQRLLQTEGVDYTLDIGHGEIKPVGDPWPSTDVVLAAFLF